MSASAQGMRVSATVWKQWVQNVTSVDCRTGHGGTADHPSLRPARRPSVRPHGGNRLAHHDAEILQCGWRSQITKK